MQALSETKEKIEKNKGKGDLRDLRAGRGEGAGAPPDLNKFFPLND